MIGSADLTIYGIKQDDTKELVFKTQLGSIKIEIKIKGV